MNLNRSVLTKLSIIMLFLLVCFIPGIKGEAADDEAVNVVGFNYKLEYPDNQIGQEKGFFDLLIPPGSEQVVTIVLSNPGKEKIAVDVSLNGAKTNPNGVVEYGTTDIENDASLQFPFEGIVSGPESVELASGEIKNLELKVKAPETSFDGLILGGIQLKKANQNEGAGKSAGATVRNEYVYVVGMVLRNKEVDVLPEIQLNKASGSQRNYRNSVMVNLSNTTGSLVKNNMSIETQIMKKGSKEVLFERKQTGMSIAPHSQMDFFVSMNGERMVEGDYTAKVLVTINDKKWEETLNFVITKEEADKYNKRDVGLVQDRGLDWKLVAYIVGGVLLVVIITFVVVKQVMKKRTQGSKKVNGPKSSNKRSSANR